MKRAILFGLWLLVMLSAIAIGLRMLDLSALTAPPEEPAASPLALADAPNAIGSTALAAAESRGRQFVRRSYSRILVGAVVRKAASAACIDGSVVEVGSSPDAGNRASDRGFARHLRPAGQRQPSLRRCVARNATVS